MYVVFASSPSLNIFEYRLARLRVFFCEPDEVRWVADPRIFLVLPFVVDHTGAVLAPPEHGVGEFLQSEPFHGLIGHKEELVGAGYDPNVNFCNLIEAVNVGVLVKGCPTILVRWP